MISVGPRENVFDWLQYVEHYETWPDCLRAIYEGGSGNWEAFAGRAPIVARLS